MSPHRPSRSTYRDGFSRPPSPALYRHIAITFLALTIIVGIGALWISSVRARVTVSVAKQSTSVETIVDISQSPQQGEVQGKVVQGTFDKIQEYTVKNQSEVPIIDTTVQGTVKISNTSSHPQTLVKTTRLQTTDGRIYRIDRAVNVPSKGNVTVTATSDKAGKDYLLAAGVKLTIPGLNADSQKLIYAESISGFNGGSKMGKFVTDSDLTDAQKDLEQAVMEIAQKTLKAEAGVADDWMAYYTKTITEKKTNAKAGDATDQFLASVKLNVVGVFFPRKDVESLIRQHFKEKLPEGRELLGFDLAQAEFNVIQPDAKLGKAQLQVKSNTSYRLSADSPELSRDNLLGLSIDDAKNKLKGITDVSNVDIILKPSWIKKLPTNRDHIEMVIN